MMNGNEDTSLKDIKDLIEALSDATYEYQDTHNGVSVCSIVAAFGFLLGRLLCIQAAKIGRQDALEGVVDSLMPMIRRSILHSILHSIKSCGD